MVRLNSHNLLGVGIYSLPEAARLLEVPTQTVTQWLYGRDYFSNGEHRRVDPIFSPELPIIEGHKSISFKDLIELRFIKIFRNNGISLQKIKKAFEEAKQTLETAHPFSTRRFYTDGKEIFLKFAKDPAKRDSVKILGLLTRQYNFPEIIEPYLRDLDYDGKDEPQRWKPISGKGEIVLDPQRHFGQPIINKYGIPTTVLYNTYKAEQEDVPTVAYWYEIDPMYVELAVEFEESLKKSKKAA